jgi:hypothetical protein
MDAIMLGDDMSDEEYRQIRDEYQAKAETLRGMNIKVKPLVMRFDPANCDPTLAIFHAPVEDGDSEQGDG